MPTESVVTTIDDVTRSEDLVGELEELWTHYLPLTRRRIGVIREAARTDRPDELDLEAVRVAAHALVGALGLYGLRGAAAIARDVERRTGAGVHDAAFLESGAAEHEHLVARPVSLVIT